MLIVMVVVAVLVANVLLDPRPKGLQCASVICSIYNPVVGAMHGPEYNNLHSTHIIAWYTAFVLSVYCNFIHI